MIIKDLLNNHQKVLEMLKVKAFDRKYQIWERKPINISLWWQFVFKKEVDYIHLNPVQAGVCKFPDDYKYSSVSFYLKTDANGFF